MAASSYLKQRKLGWYVQLAVPRKHQAAIGSKVLVRSLGTRDKAEANRRKHAMIAELQSLLAQADAKAPTEHTPEDLLRFALEEREAIEGGGDPVDSAAAFDAATDAYLEQEAARLGRDAEGHPRLPPASLATVRRAHKALKGNLEATLGHQAESYLDEQKARLTAQTLGDKRRRLAAFLEWFGADRDCVEVTRKVAGTYVAEVIQKRTQEDAEGSVTPLSPVTRRKEVSDLRSFFDWLMARGVVDANPFDRMASTVKASTRGKAASRRPWLPAELSKVLRGVDANDPLWAMTVLAAYTGMRREEVGELHVSSLEGNVLKVETGKTAAAVRRVPIHPVIAPLVKQLAKASTDGYLIPGLLRGGPDKKRAWYVGKRFGRIIRQLGIADTALDFHALRGTVITQLEGAGVPESTIQLIVGHKRQGMTLGTYSGGVPDKVKRAAIVHLSYGKQLDGLVAERGAGVTVKPSAKARKRAY